MNQAITILKNMKRGAILKKDIPFVYLRFLMWQIRIRFKKDRKIIKWVNQVKLEVYPHMTISTGNYYFGLMEFPEMAFVMHYLRQNNLMFDVGANIGDYALLAAGVAKSKALAIEPIPETVEFMKRNIKLNGVEKLIKIETSAVGCFEQQVEFFCDSDATNQKKIPGGGYGERKTCIVKMKRLDSLFRENGIPDLIKIDVEGYEDDVILSAGGKILEKKLNVLIVELNNQKLITQLQNIGFYMYGYNPFTRELFPTEEEDGRNGIFIRDIELASKRVKMAPPFIVNGYSI